MRATILFYNTIRGFGFARPEGATDRGADLFVHASQLRKAGLPDLKEGDRISCDVRPSPTRPDKLQATNIDKLAA